MKLTKMEAKALWDAAKNMEDDFEDYFSFMGKAKVKKYHKAYQSGMIKLREYFQSPNKKEKKK